MMLGVFFNFSWGEKGPCFLQKEATRNPQPRKDHQTSPMDITTTLSARWARIKVLGFLDPRRVGKGLRAAIRPAMAPKKRARPIDLKVQLGAAEVSSGHIMYSTIST